MAAKKSVRKKSGTGKSARKKSATKAAGRKSVTKAAGPRTATKRKAAGKSVARKKNVVAKPRPSTRKTTAAARRTAALGRPRVAGTAELERMFQKDLEAREVFEFLGVKTLKELETLSPDQILERLTAPMVRTVGRIRKSLAMNNRCLAGDQKFAVAFKKQLT
jgi:hypothetical protein